MGKRFWWFAVGVGLTAVIVWKGRAWYRRYTPQGIADQLHDAREGLTDRVSGFVATFQEAMMLREAELREALEPSEQI